MFGDIGHGGLIFLVGLGLCHFSDEIYAKLGKRSPLLMFMQLRYLLLLMGFFAFFCGLMYNDFCAIPLFFKSSCYDIKYHEDGTLVTPQSPKQFAGCVHNIGIDPVWYLTTQEITYLNSLKMKLAVIIGVAHMSLGICMKGLNA
jgi:V-type H+-transporting ATPase subunit a